jgi:hypothetical protein
MNYRSRVPRPSATLLFSLALISLLLFSDPFRSNRVGAMLSGADTPRAEAAAAASEGGQEQGAVGAGAVTPKAQECPAPQYPLEYEERPHTIVLSWIAPAPFPNASYKVLVRDLAGVEHSYIALEPHTVVGSGNEPDNPPLDPNQDYYVEIRTLCGDMTSGDYLFGFFHTHVEECETVKNVQITEGETSADVTWDKAPGALSYDVLYKEVNSTETPARQTFENPPAHIGLIAPLKPNTPYELWVVTYCGADPGQSKESEHVTFTTRPAPSGLPVCKPVDGLTISHYNAFSADVHFVLPPQDPVYSIFKFLLVARDANDKVIFSTLLDPPKVGNEIAGLIDVFAPEQDYTISVQTDCWAGRDSRSSEVVNAPLRTKECPKPMLNAKPEVTYKTAKVSWKAEDSDDYSFRVHAWTTAPGGDDHTETTDEGRGNTTLTLGERALAPPLWSNQFYQYNVRTICGKFESEPSDPDGRLDIFTTSPCPVPTNVFVVDASRTITSLKVKWDNVAPGGGYEVRWRLYCGECATDADDPDKPWHNIFNPDRDVTIAGLTPNTQYEVQVRSLCAGNEPPRWSPRLGPIKTLKCNSAAPNATVKNISGRTAELHWNDVPGTGFYQYQILKGKKLLAGPFDIVRDANPPSEFVQAINVDEKCEDYTAEVRSSCSPQGAPNPVFSNWSDARFTSGGCKCERTFVKHGDSCNSTFAFKYQSGGGVGGGPYMWRVAWGVTEESTPSRFEFRWRDCGVGRQPICFGPYFQAPAPSVGVRSDRDCPGHIDYFVNSFPLDYSFPPDKHYYQLEVRYHCENGVDTGWQSDIYYYDYGADPFSPIQLRATSATFGWKFQEGVLGYVISYGAADSGEQTTLSLGPNDTQVTLEKLTPSTLYNVSFSPVREEGSGIPKTLEFTTTADDSCGYSASPTSASYEAGGGGGTVSVTADGKCPWVATSDSPWLGIVSGGSGVGTGAVRYTVEPNAGAETRTGKLEVAGIEVLVSQVGAASNPAPFLSSVSPDAVLEGGGDFVLNVSGSGFTNNSVVMLDGVSHSTTFQNSGLLSAQVLASEIAHTGNHAVTVFNPAPGGGTSNALNLSVTTPTGCIRHAPALGMSPSDQRGYGGQQLVYHVTLTNNDDVKCGATTFNISPTLPGLNWVQTPTSMNFTIVPGEAAERDVIISSAPAAPVATHTIRETVTSWVGHSGVASATYTVYSLQPPDTCGRSSPSIAVSPSDQQGRRGQQLSYHLTLTNNDNPQCGATSFSVIPTLPGAGWVHTPASVGLTLAPGESGGRDVVISSSPTAPFAPYAFTENVTSSFGHSAAEGATYTVYDTNPPDTCGHADPTVTVEPNYQSGTQAQSLGYTVSVANNDSTTCYGSSFIVRPILPTAPGAGAWVHVPQGYFTLFVLPGRTASRTVSVISASTAEMGEHTIVWTASHTDYNSGSGDAVFNVIPYNTAGLLLPSRWGEPADFYQLLSEALWPRRGLIYCRDPLSGAGR